MAVVAVEDCTFTVVVLTTPAKVAETVTGWFALTVPAFTIAEPDAAPAAIVNDAGAVNTALLVDIVTAVDTGAIAFSVIVHVVLAPEAMDDGEHEIPARAAGAGEAVTFVMVETPFAVAVTTTVTVVATTPALAVNVCVFEPAATKTDPGNGSAAELLVSITLRPPAPAAVDNVTMQFVVPVLAIVAGKQAIDDGPGVALSAVWSGGLTAASNFQPGLTPRPAYPPRNTSALMAKPFGIPLKSSL